MRYKFHSCKFARQIGNECSPRRNVVSCLLRPTRYAGTFNCSVLTFWKRSLENQVRCLYAPVYATRS